MTETERLLREATEIAKRHFLDPSEQAVMQIFSRLSFEQEAASSSFESYAGATH